MRTFLWRRLIGVANIADGIVTLFTPFSAGLSLRAAKRYARSKWFR